MTIPNPQVDAFIAQYQPEVQELVQALRRLVREAAPDVQETFKWSQPCFELRGILCSIMPHGDYVRLQFWRGAELPDSQGLLKF